MRSGEFLPFLHILRDFFYIKKPITITDLSSVVELLNSSYVGITIDNPSIKLK